MEVMENYLPHFAMNLSMLLYLMGLLKLKTREDLPGEFGHHGRGHIIVINKSTLRIQISTGESP